MWKLCSGLHDEAYQLSQNLWLFTLNTLDNIQVEFGPGANFGNRVPEWAPGGETGGYTGG